MRVPAVMWRNVSPSFRTCGANAATENAIALMRRAVELMAEPQRREALAKSPALRALQLGIWSDNSQIDPEEVRRLGPLWLKYFQENS